MTDELTHSPWQTRRPIRLVELVHIMLGIGDEHISLSRACGWAMDSAHLSPSHGHTYMAIPVTS